MKRYCKRNIGSLVLFGLACILTSVSVIILAFLQGALVETAMAGEFSQVWPLAVGTLFYVLLDAAIYFLWEYSRDLIVQRISRDLRADLVDKFSHLPYEEKRKHDDGWYTSMVVNDVDTVRVDYISAILGIAFQVCFFLFTVITSLTIQPVMTLIMIAVSIPTILYPKLTEKPLQRAKEEAQAAKSGHLSALGQFLGGFFLLKIFDSFQGMGRTYDKANGKLCDKNIRFGRMQDLLYAGSYVCGGLVSLGTWAIGVFFVVGGFLTLPMLVTFARLMDGVAAPVQVIGERYAELVASSAVWKRLKAFLDAPGGEEERWGAAPLEGVDALEVRGLSYAVDDRRLLDGVDMKLRRGDRVALLGESGSGKSTLLKVLAAVADGQGEYTLNGRPFRDYAARDFRRGVTLLEQKSFVFEGSIRDNITLFDPSPAPDGPLEALLDRVGLGPWLADRGGSLDAAIGKESLSGGEERRLDLARILCRGASVVLLDEPTTGLDPETKAAVEQTILDMDCDLLVVAMHEYSPQFFARFNRVFRVEAGHVREEQV